MYLPMSWLKEYVDIDCSVKEFADAMTLSGSKVEAVEHRGQDITKVVVCKILEIERHPDAEKLFVTKVDIGAEESLQIVTNATNVSVGDLVPLALDGATLSDGLKIKKGKLRGILSQGMFCSVEEFGYNKSDYPEAPEEGVYIFKQDHPLGSDVKQILQIDEDIVEFEITSNRADCFSIIGLAREAAATFRKKLNYPKIELKEQLKDDINSFIKINIDSKELCPRYTCRVIKNVKIAPSPQWLRHRLTSAGIRPINNIVDITNYVMLEIGQPMHAFNINHISGREMTVRTAKDGEKITTLDGVERSLDSSMLIISDKDKIIDLAGIMGGENSMITEDVTTVLLESANFEGNSIRLTSKKLGLRTDASSKYEKSLDPNLSITALNRACQLIQMLDCGEVVSSAIDIYSQKTESFEVEYSTDRINKLLGTDISQTEMIDLLKLIEVESDGKTAKIPTFRQDLEREADIAEEIARFYGYDNIKTTLFTGTPTVGKKTYKQKVTDIITNSMIAMGFNETLNYSFESPKVFNKLKIDESSDLRKTVTIQNPLGEDFSIMRTTTLNGILQSISTNYNRRNQEAALFEIGKIYLPKSLPLAELPEEKEILTIAMYGEVDFFDLKGNLEELFSALGFKDKVQFEPNEKLSFMHPTRTANMMLSESKIGYLGELRPEVCKNYSIGAKVYVASIDINTLLKNTNLERTFKPLPKFPSMQRDIAMLVKDDINSSEIEKIIIKNGGKLLEEVKLFDVYKGNQIEDGYKSIAYNILFRSSERTLTDEDLDAPMKKILENLQEKLNAQLREK